MRIPSFALAALACAALPTTSLAQEDGLQGPPYLQGR